MAGETSQPTLTNGTRPTAHNISLTSTDICRILNVAHKCQVARLTFGALSVEFQSSAGVAERTEGTQPNREARTPQDVGTFAPPDMPPEEITEVDEELAEEFRKVDLLMNDPSGFEQEIVDDILNAEQGPLDEVDGA